MPSSIPIYAFKYWQKISDKFGMNNYPRFESLHNYHGLQLGKSILQKRIAAFFIDITLVVIIKHMLVGQYHLYLAKFFSHLPMPTKLAIVQTSSGVNFTLDILVYFSYTFLCLYTTNGRTLGKLFMGLRVVHREIFIDAKPIFALKPWMTFKRCVGYNLCFVFAYLPYFINFVSKDHRGIPDYLSSLIVITDTKYTEITELKNARLEITGPILLPPVPENTDYDDAA